MADRINLIEDDDTEDTSFRFTPKRVVSAGEYGSSFINFYNTTLGLPSLGQETGIEVREDITELAEPGRSPKRDEPSDDPSETGVDPFDVINTQPIVFYNDNTSSTNVNFDSYSDYLSSAQDGKFKDRVGLVQNVLEPTVTGNFREIDLGAGLSSEVKATAQDIGAEIKEAPSRAERLITGNLDERDSKSLAAGLASAMAGPVGGVAGTFIGGTEVRNAFGNNSFRPAGPLGFVADLVHAKQYDARAKNRAVRSAYAQGDMAGTDFGRMNFSKVDVGFEMTIGNLGIVRAAGEYHYSGNMQGLSHQTVRALEAISKGYDPTRGRYNFRDPSKSLTVEEAGGLQVSGNPMDGFFRANGTVYNPKFIGHIGGASGAFPSRAMILGAAKTHGVSEDQFRSALSQARSGNITLGDAVRRIKSQEDAIRKAEADRKEKAEADRIRDANLKAQQRAAARAAEKTAAQIAEEARERARKQQQQQDDGGTPSYSPPTEYSISTGFEDRTDFGGSSGPFAEGGRVGLAMGGAPGMASGFVDRPPEQVPEDQTVADNRATQLPEGAFVINAAAVEFAGSNDIKDMLLKAHKESLRRGLSVDKQGNGAKLIDVAISSGEVVVAPHLAKIIGYDRLNKINNRGKAETRERIEENGQPEGMQARSGGFINRYNGGDVSTRYAGPLSAVELMKSGLNVSSPVSQGFIEQEPFDTGPVPTGLDDTAHGYRIGDVMAAIQAVETKGYENKNGGYIFTKSDKKGKRSSAFGPYQITGETVADLLKRNSNVARQIKFDPGFGDYINAFIAQGVDAVNIRKTGKKYVGPEDNRTPVKISNAVKKLYGPLGVGEIPRELHDKYYPMLAEYVVKQKASDAGSFDEWIKSYGNNTEAYLKKVKTELDKLS
tara:strand:- start:1820 stop:4483 length:2664 start_codon:yes stop_codon:yes gene_type:complete